MEIEVSKHYHTELSFHQRVIGFELGILLFVFFFSKNQYLRATVHMSRWELKEKQFVFVLLMMFDVIVATFIVQSTVVVNTT